MGASVMFLTPISDVFNITDGGIATAITLQRLLHFGLFFSLQGCIYASTKQDVRSQRNQLILTVTKKLLVSVLICNSLILKMLISHFGDLPQL